MISASPPRLERPIGPASALFEDEGDAGRREAIIVSGSTDQDRIAAHRDSFPKTIQGFQVPREQFGSLVGAVVLPAGAFLKEGGDGHRAAQ